MGKYPRGGRGEDGPHQSFIIAYFRPKLLSRHQPVCFQAFVSEITGNTREWVLPIYFNVKEFRSTNPYSLKHYMMTQTTDMEVQGMEI